MASLEYNVETVLLAVLAANNAFAATGIPAKHWNDNADAAKDRVTVKALPAKEEIHNKDKTQVLVWRVDLEIDVIYATKQTAVQMDDVVAAVESAIQSPTTAGVITQSGALFPNGIEPKIAEGVEREIESDKRSRLRQFYCLVRP